MNFKTTIVLLLLAGGCVLLFWKGPEWAPYVGLASKPGGARHEQASADLAHIDPKEITRIDIKEVAPKGATKPVVTFEASKTTKTLELPGSWPVRQSEVEDLVATLGGLKSRFEPIPIGKDADLKPYGLDPSQHPLLVAVEAAGKTNHLEFGQGAAKPGENPFVRSTYVRIGDRNEIWRLSPGIMAALSKPEDAYRRRQLYPEVDRLKVAGAAPARSGSQASAATVMLLGDQAKTITVEGPAGRFVLQRVAPMPKPAIASDKPGAEALVSPDQLAESWVLVEPVHDHVDPAKLRSILTSIPELIVQQFDDRAVTWFKTGLSPNSLEKFLGSAAFALPTPAGLSSAFDVAASLAVLNAPAPPVSKITVTLNDGTSRTIYIGNVSRSSQRMEMSPPMFPMQPPQPRFITEEYVYAKVGDNPIVFELKDDLLKDLYVLKSASSSSEKVAEQLRDPNVVRFDVNEVVKIDVVQPVADSGKTTERRFELVKVKGDPQAGDLSARQDRWELVQPVKDKADSTAVTEMLEAIKGLEARKGSIVDADAHLIPAIFGAAAAVDPKLLLGLTPDRVKQVTLTFAPGSSAKPITLVLGQRDPETNKRSVYVAGWERVSVIEDKPDSRLDRQPSAFRTLKLFDAGSKISDVVVQRSATDTHAADTYTLAQQGGPPSKWAITAPFKAETDSSALNRLISELGNLGSQKYVFDARTDVPFKVSSWPTFLTSLGIAAPSGEAAFGLEHPPLTITLKFSEPKGAEDIVLEIGRPKSDTEYYARVKGTTGIFVIPDRVVKAIDQKPEELVDKTLIHFAAKPDVQSIKRQMDGQELELVQNNSALWEIAKPTQAKADQTIVDELSNSLTSLHAARIESVAPKSLKDFGLEPPAATVTVEAMEKTKLVERVLLIGNPVDPKNPQGDRYVKAQGSTMVAVIPGALADKLIAPVRKFQDLNLGGFVSADRIVMEQGDRKVTFVKGAGGWKVKEPLEADAEDEELRELHDQLARLRADEIVEDKPKDLARYGLDKPIQWIIFNGDREVMHLLVGNHEQVGGEKKSRGLRVYAMLAKRGPVVLLDWRLSHALTTEYRKRALGAIIAPADIKEIAVKTANPADSFTFVKGPNGWTDPERPADKLNQGLVESLAATLGSLHLDRFVVDKGADLARYGLDHPRRLTVTSTTGVKRTVDVGKFDGKQLYARLDDPSRSDVFLLGPSDSTLIDQRRSAYVVGTAKEEPKKGEPKKAEVKKEEPKKADAPKDDFKKSPDEKKEPESNDALKKDEK